MLGKRRGLVRRFYTDGGCEDLFVQLSMSEPGYPSRYILRLGRGSNMYQDWGRERLLNRDRLNDRRSDHFPNLFFIARIVGRIGEHLIV